MDRPGGSHGHQRHHSVPASGVASNQTAAFSIVVVNSADLAAAPQFSQAHPAPTHRPLSPRCMQHLPFLHHCQQPVIVACDDAVSGPVPSVTALGTPSSPATDEASPCDEACGVTASLWHDSEQAFMVSGAVPMAAAAGLTSTSTPLAFVFSAHSSVAAADRGAAACAPKGPLDALPPLPPLRQPMAMMPGVPTLAVMRTPGVGGGGSGVGAALLIASPPPVAVAAGPVAIAGSVAVASLPSPLTSASHVLHDYQPVLTVRPISAAMASHYLFTSRAPCVVFDLPINSPMAAAVAAAAAAAVAAASPRAGVQADSGSESGGSREKENAGQGAAATPDAARAAAAGRVAAEGGTGAGSGAVAAAAAAAAAAGSAQPSATRWRPRLAAASACTPASHVTVAGGAASKKRKRSEPLLGDEAAELAGSAASACAAPDVAASPGAAPAVQGKQRRVRCGMCRARLSLTQRQAPCKCGGLFCGIHRYPEEHECTVDYRSEGRAQLSKENPVVRPAKLARLL